MADDFVYFRFSNLDPSKYQVLVQSMSTSGTLWRNIGDLHTEVHLPFVHFSPYARIAVVPKDDPRLPRFSSHLVRGATYVVPDVGKRIGEFEMERYGGKF